MHYFVRCNAPEETREKFKLVSFRVLRKHRYLHTGNGINKNQSHHSSFAHSRTSLFVFCGRLLCCFLLVYTNTRGSNSYGVLRGSKIYKAKCEDETMISLLTMPVVEFNLY